MRRITLPGLPLSSPTFAAYGERIRTEGYEPTVAGEGFRFWDGLAGIGGRSGASAGMVRVEAAPREATVFEEHRRSAELLLPVEGPIDLLLGRASPSRPDQPDPDRFAAFRVEPGEGALLHPRTWHRAPIAGTGTVSVWVLFAPGTFREDCHLHDTVADNLTLHLEPLPSPQPSNAL